MGAIFSFILILSSLRAEEDPDYSGIEKDTVYDGRDYVPGYINKQKNLRECVRSCRITHNCNFWTYDESGKSCSLKKDKGYSRKKYGFTSGSKDSKVDGNYQRANEPSCFQPCTSNADCPNPLKPDVWERC